MNLDYGACRLKSTVAELWPPLLVYISVEARDTLRLKDALITRYTVVEKEVHVECRWIYLVSLSILRYIPKFYASNVSFKTMKRG